MAKSGANRKPHLVTAVIPAYNASRYLAQALRSVFEQTRIPDEILVVDDCSTDNTVEIVRSFDDPRLKLLTTHKNSGSAVARNLGIQAASGDLIALLDADDIWLPNHCATVSGLLEGCDEAALAFSLTEAFGDRQWTWPQYIVANRPVRCFWECLKRTIIPQMNIVARRQALLDIGGYRPDLRQTQDFDLCLRLSYRYPVICTDQVTTRYRRHPDSITARNPFRALGGEYIARHLFWKENYRAMDAATRDRFEQVLCDIWIENVTDAWNRSDLPALSFHLSQHEFVTRSAGPYKAWMKRRRLFRLKKAWASCPAALRSLIQIALRPLVSYVHVPVSATAGASNYSASLAAARRAEIPLDVPRCQPMTSDTMSSSL
jgi:glycosyltransferase involved in cell wall biosynthesis